MSKDSVRTWENWLSRVQVEDRARVISAWQAAGSGRAADVTAGVGWMDAEGRSLKGDVLIVPVLYADRPAIQVMWIESGQQGEAQRRRESEVMRDILAALASATGIQQALEVILVNLQGLIHYDRAGLFLAEMDSYYGALGVDSDFTRNIPTENSVLEALEQTRQPLVIRDIQADPRFTDWPDMQSVRGWMGAPLLAGEQVIGFLSLGSLELDAYQQADIDTMQVFATQVAEVLEKAWKYEQSYRRSQQLEVISNFTSILGHAESSTDTLAAILSEISGFFGAQSGVFLLAGSSQDELVVKVSLDETMLGFAHTRSQTGPSNPVSVDGPGQPDQAMKDVIWQVYDTSQTVVVVNIAVFLQDHPELFYQKFLTGMRAAAFIPLTIDQTTFGVLCLAFSTGRQFSFDDIHLYDTVAEIAGASFQRALALESLERQLNIRTQHLSTLYEINALAGEPLSLEIALQGILQIILNAMNFRAGAIHLYDESTGALRLIVNQSLSASLLAQIERLPVGNNLWAEIAQTTQPIIVNDLRQHPGLAQEIRDAVGEDAASYLGAPMRAKGQFLGLLSVFGESVLSHAIEEITLFMTIADQIGGYVERAGLIQQAERAAVIEERQRLARELHDSVTQLLYGQVLFAGASLKVLAQGDDGLAADHLARIDQAALQALKEMRLLVYELRPSNLAELGIAQALERRLEAVERRTGVDAQLFVEGELNLDRKIEMELFRITEEALNNTLKHAQAKTVTIVIHQFGDELTLYIEDDGVGFQKDVEYGGMGLQSMHERAQALGGHLLIDTAPGQGVRLFLKIEVTK